MDLFLVKHKVLFPIFFKGLDFSISDFALTVLGVPLGICCLMAFASRKIAYYPSFIQNIVEMIYEALYGIFISYLGQEGKKYIPFLFSLMIFIFILNISNLIPGLFASSSQLSLTLTLGLMVFFLIIAVGFYEYKLKFLSMFIPVGIPGVLKPVLFVLELFSFIIRPFSLALRLAINMIAGHVMLHQIASFSKGFSAISVLTIAISSILSIFEIVVAGLQAYVFAVLSCIYIADILHGHVE